MKSNNCGQCHYFSKGWSQAGTCHAKPPKFSIKRFESGEHTPQHSCVRPVVGVNDLACRFFAEVQS